VDDDEVQEILALSVSEDNKKKRKEPSRDDGLYSISLYI